MSQLRRIAVKMPSEDHFIFPIEGGPDDKNSHYDHNSKYPSGGFTGERWSMINGVPNLFRVEDHEDRLEQTIQAVEWLEIGCTRQARIDARFRLIALNPGDCYLSLMFGSHGDVGVMPKSNVAKVVINSRGFDRVKSAYLPERVVREGMNVRITESDIHRGPYSQFSAAKLGRNYLFSNIAKFRALQAGLDDAIMLDEQGDVSELSVSNLILLEDQHLISPWPLSSPLNGVTKRTMATIGQEIFGLGYSEEQISIDRLKGIRGAVACGTAIGNVLIKRFIKPDGSLLWELQDREAETLLRQFGDLYWNAVEGVISGYHPEWHTPVPEDILRLPEPLVLKKNI